MQRDTGTSHDLLIPIRRWFVLPILVLLIAAFAFDIAGTNLSPDPNNVDARDTARFLAAQPDAGDAVIYSDMWPLTAWYMRRNVVAMPIFDDPVAVSHELHKNGATYYAATGMPNVPKPVPAGFRSALDSGQCSRVRALFATACTQDGPRTWVPGGRTTSSA